MANEFETIGSVIKAHGLKGEVIIEPEVANPYQLETIKLFYIANKRGDIEPYRVEQAHVVEKNNRFSFFVKFVHLTERSHAEQLRNKEVMIPAYEYENLDQFDFSYHECIEWEVVNEQGEPVGKVLDVMDNPAHELLEIKTSQGVVLVPAVDEYIAEIDEETQQLTVKNLDALMQI